MRNTNGFMQQKAMENERVQKGASKEEIKAYYEAMNASQAAAKKLTFEEMCENAEELKKVQAGRNEYEASREHFVLVRNGKVYNQGRWYHNYKATGNGKLNTSKAYWGGATLGDNYFPMDYRQNEHWSTLRGGRFYQKNYHVDESSRINWAIEAFNNVDDCRIVNYKMIGDQITMDRGKKIFEGDLFYGNGNSFWDEDESYKFLAWDAYQKNVLEPMGYKPIVVTSEEALPEACKYAYMNKAEYAIYKDGETDSAVIVNVNEYWLQNSYVDSSFGFRTDGGASKSKGLEGAGADPGMTGDWDRDSRISSDSVGLQLAAHKEWVEWLKQLKDTGDEHYEEVRGMAYEHKKLIDDDKFISLEEKNEYGARLYDILGMNVDADTYIFCKGNPLADRICSGYSVSSAVKDLISLGYSEDKIEDLMSEIFDYVTK